MLNEIYQTYIQYSFHPLSPDQDVLFKEYNKNKKDYANYANLNMVYALVRKAFKNQDLEDKPIDLDELITNSFQLFGIEDIDGYTFQTLNQIAEIADITGTQNRNYFDVDLFFIKHINKLQGSSIDTEQQLTYHIKLLHLVAHIYFRKKQFLKSIEFLQKMHDQMIRYDHKYFGLNETRYTTLMALNYNFSGKAVEAASLLDELLAQKGGMQLHQRGILQVILLRIVIHFQQTEFKEAKQLMALLWHQDKWYLNHVGLEWLTNKKIIEILIEIELENTDRVDSLISSILRKRKVYFKGANALAIPFLKLVETYHRDQQHVRSSAFESLVESTFDWKPSEEEDLFFMSYYAWLKSKMTGKSLYDITLGFLRNDIDRMTTD